MAHFVCFSLSLSLFRSTVSCSFSILIFHKKEKPHFGNIIRIWSYISTALTVSLSAVSSGLTQKQHDSSTAQAFVFFLAWNEKATQATCSKHVSAAKGCYHRSLWVWPASDYTLETGISGPVRADMERHSWKFHSESQFTPKQEMDFLWGMSRMMMLARSRE